MDSWAVANDLAGWSGTWKEHDWKIGDKEVWERGMDLSEWVKMKIFVSHVNAHQRVTSAEEDFSKVDRMTHFVDTSFFPQSSLSSPNGLMNKVAMVAVMEVMHGCSNMVFHSPRLTWL